MKTYYVIRQQIFKVESEEQLKEMIDLDAPPVYERRTIKECSK